MKPEADDSERRNRIIAGLLRYGTWFASALITAGLLFMTIEPLPASVALSLTGHDLAKAGVAAFILLPIARVALMCVIFLSERDYAYAAIAALVLAIIAVGVIVEI